MSQYSKYYLCQDLFDVSLDWIYLYLIIVLIMFLFCQVFVFSLCCFSIRTFPDALPRPPTGFLFHSCTRFSSLSLPSSCVHSAFTHSFNLSSASVFSSQFYYTSSLSDQSSCFHILISTFSFQEVQFIWT